MAWVDNDDHFCLRCDTPIRGLEAYVKHRQTDCSERNEQEKETEGCGSERDEQPSNSPPESASSQASRPLRKRKAADLDASPKKSPRNVAASSPRGLRTPKKVDGEAEIESAMSPDSPRRSGRRGTRISYTDLLSGVDRNEAKKSGEGRGSHLVVKSRAGKTKVVRKKNLLSMSKRGRKPAKIKISAAQKNKYEGESSEEAEDEVMDTLQEQNLAPETDRKSLGNNSITIKVEDEQESNKSSEEDGQGETVPLVDNGENYVDEVIYIKSGKFYCHVCEIYCLSKKKVDEHCATRKHAKRLKANQENADWGTNNSKADAEDKELLECDTCPYRTRNKGQYERHLRSVYHAQRNNVTLFGCEKCHRKYRTEAELESHQEYHLTPRCRKCKQIFESEELLEEHLDEESHRIEFRCRKCDKTFVTKGNLKTHARIHAPDTLFKCDMCPFQSAQSGDMKRHMYRHRGYKPFKCTLCEYESVTKSSMERHMKIHEDRTRDFKCDECGSAFFDSNLLKQHKYMRHNPERKFPCPYEGCTFAYKYRSSLVTHTRMHTQEKPFLCAECGHATSTKHSLTKHMRLHTGEKPFECDFPNCNYRSRLSTHLARHKIIHTGIKPYKCPLCNYACNNKQNLRKHLISTKAHKGTPIYNCRKCDNYSSNSFRDYVAHLRKEHAGADEYVSFFDVAEDVRRYNDEQSTGECVVEKYVTMPAREDGESGNDDLETFSVVTVVPGRETSSREVRNIASILADGEEVEKLEQVILSLENGREVDGGTKGAFPIEVDSMGNITVAAEHAREHGETIVIIPEVQAETEIHTSERAGSGDRQIQEYIVEIDQSGRPVTKEDMAAATWLHNMGIVQGATVETIMPEAGVVSQQIAAEQEVQAEPHDNQ